MKVWALFINGNINIFSEKPSREEAIKANFGEYFLPQEEVLNQECEIITNTDATTLIRQASSLLNGAGNKINASNIEETQQELDELYNVAFILQKEIDKLKERG